MAQAQKILIADDDEMLLSVLRAVLEHQGYDVYEASNGQEALDAFKQTAFDLVLLDIMMPVLDGYDACRLMRDHDVNHEVAIVMATGADDEHAIVQAFSAGANEFVIKPLNLASLSRQIDFWICNHQMMISQRNSLQQVHTMLATVTDSLFLFSATNTLECVHLGELGKQLAWPTQTKKPLSSYFDVDTTQRLIELVQQPQHQTSYGTLKNCHFGKQQFDLDFNVTQTATQELVLTLRESKKSIFK